MSSLSESGWVDRSFSYHQAFACCLGRLFLHIGNGDLRCTIVAAGLSPSFLTASQHKDDMNKRVATYHRLLRIKGPLCINLVTPHSLVDRIEAWKLISFRASTFREPILSQQLRLLSRLMALRPPLSVYPPSGRFLQGVCPGTTPALDRA